MLATGGRATERLQPTHRPASAARESIHGLSLAMPSSLTARPEISPNHSFTPNCRLGCRVVECTDGAKTCQHSPRRTCGSAWSSPTSGPRRTPFVATVGPFSRPDFSRNSRKPPRRCVGGEFRGFFRCLRLRRCRRDEASRNASLRAYGSRHEMTGLRVEAIADRWLIESSGEGRELRLYSFSACPRWTGLLSVSA